MEVDGDVDAEMIFSEGKEVEVTSDEEGFKGAWFTATILKLPKNKTKEKALVQYKNLLEDDNQKPLTENIKLSFIRPVPPQSKVAEDHRFEVNDVVDAFHLDGWWTGFVSEVFDDPKKYSVSFPEPPEKIEFSSSDLRPHWKWVDGKWVKPSNFQEIVVSSDGQAPVDLSCNTTKDPEEPIQLESDTVICSTKKHELFCVSSRKNEMGLSTACKVTAKVKKVKRAKPEGDPSLLHPSKKLKDGSLARSLILRESSMKVLPSETPNKEVPTAAIFPGKDGIGEQPAVETGKHYVRDEVDTELPKVEGLREEKVGLPKECGRMLKSHVEGPEHPAEYKMNNLKVAAVGVSEVNQITNESESSVTQRLQIEYMNGSGTEEACHVNKEEINLQEENGTIRHEKEDAAKTGINRRENLVLESKQPKLVLNISQSPSAGKNYATGVLKEMVSNECIATEVESSMISGLEQADCQREEIVLAGKSGGILHGNKEQSTLILCNELQSGLRRIHPVVMEETSSGNILHGFPDQRNNPRENSLEIIAQSALVSMTGHNEPEGEELPFVKSLPIWKAIESMEVFQVMPQNPHFHPLFKLKEILREGLAIGYMFTFASLVQRTSKLTVGDPRNHFTSILDGLLDLEMLGFDVKAVRGRTSELLFMKDRHGHLQEQSKEVEVQVTQHSNELTLVNEEIDVNKKMVRELEAKQAILLALKESKISEIASLQVSADVTTQDIQSVEDDFESLVSCPW